MNYFVVWFTKITGLPVQWLFFRKKIYYEDKNSQNRKIKGGALIISNHTSVYDYALIMFTFISRNITVLIAKSTLVLNKFLKSFMPKMGSICVDRKSYDFSFMTSAESKLNRNKTVLIFPEGRLPLPEEKENDLLEFKPSFVYIALNSNKPIIPVYTNGEYGFKNIFTKKRAKIIIGKKIYAHELIDKTKTESENIEYICNYVRDYIKQLKDKLLKIEQEKKQQIPLLLKIFDYKMFFHDFVKITGAIPVICDLRIKRIYIKNKKVTKKPKNLYKGKFIIISNHKSYKDPVIILNTFWKRRISFIALDKFFETKLGNFIFKGFGCIKINRESPSLKTFKEVKNVLNRGHLIGIFPEGKIGKEEKIDNFKSGAVLFSLMNDCPIVPIYIAKRNHWYNRQRVYIGDKIYPDRNNLSPSLDQINNFSKILREKELELKKISGE